MRSLFQGDIAMHIPPPIRRSHPLLGALALAAATLLAAAPNAALAAAYIKLDGIDGESTDVVPGPAVCHVCWSGLAGFRVSFPSTDGRQGWQPLQLTGLVSPDFAAAVHRAWQQGQPMPARLRIVSDGGRVADDVIVDGRIVTAENYDTATGTLSFALGAMTQLRFSHNERQRDGSFAETAAGGWGLQGLRGFQGQPGVFDALAALGAVRQGDGSWVLTSAVPEPSTYALLAAGLGVIVLRATRRTSA
jgi:putative intracellular protease/amidase